ncbi:hypothetical protein PPACK8108_LOCUS24642 [Phakopsora pachyrhizi]|uniref:Uncharacterized protein n=1 Tax=Phakopsora pachyrhizi TaxID=170000 RepID=A0AAV0BSB7_PHAPC|nr:hypothetical protein PPACK8108_LOCUS24642 [Phakopsora pachyrhizi]
MTNRTLVVDVEPPNNSEPQIRQLPTPTTPRDARIIALVLASMGVQSSFKGVVRVLMEFAHRAEVQRHVTQSPEQLRDSNGGLETSHSQRYQLEHSWRGSMSSETYASANSNQATGLHSASTLQASLPNLTLGTRVRSKDPQFNDTTSWQIGPHPYGLILPGQEVRRPPVKIRTVSNVTQSTVGLLRSVSSNHNKTISIGSCCFTQTAKSPISGGGTLSAVSTSNQAVALHARRFSTIARDPSIAIVSPNLSAAGNNNESVNINEGQKQLLLV